MARSEALGYSAGMILLAMDPNLVPIVFVAGIAVLAWLVMRMQGRKKPARPSEFVPSFGPKSSDMKVMGDELNNLVVELRETSREIAAQIDSRYQKLDVLLAEADARIKRLEELKRELDGATADRRGAVIAAVREETRLEDPKYRPIYELADQGKTAREIAQVTGAQPGEVELILALRGSGGR